MICICWTELIWEGSMTYVDSHSILSGWDLEYQLQFFNESRAGLIWELDEYYAWYRYILSNNPTRFYQVIKIKSDLRSTSYAVVVIKRNGGLNCMIELKKLNLFVYESFQIAVSTNPWRNEAWKSKTFSKKEEILRVIYFVRLEGLRSKFLRKDQIRILTCTVRWIPLSEDWEEELLAQFRELLKKEFHKSPINNS